MAVLAIIDLTSKASFEFEFFPEELGISSANNWEPQNTAGGKTPLFYRNAEQDRMTFDEVFLDSTLTGDSLKESLSDLKKHCMAERDDTGRPPSLLVTWGDQSFQGVMTRMDRREIFFNEEGNCMRARFSLELLGIQDEGEATNLVVGI